MCLSWIELMSLGDPTSHSELKDLDMIFFSKGVYIQYVQIVLSILYSNTIIKWTGPIGKDGDFVTLQNCLLL